jgi:hypothetical protein
MKLFRDDHRIGKDIDGNQYCIVVERKLGTAPGGLNALREMLGVGGRAVEEGEAVQQAEVEVEVEAVRRLLARDYTMWSYGPWRTASVF